MGLEPTDVAPGLSRVKVDDVEYNVEAALATEQGRYLILTDDNGGNRLVNAGHLQDIGVSVPRLSPEQREAQREDLRRQLAALEEQESGQESDSQQPSLPSQPSQAQGGTDGSDVTGNQGQVI